MSAYQITTVSPYDLEAFIAEDPRNRERLYELEANPDETRFMRVPGHFVRLAQPLEFPGFEAVNTGGGFSALQRELSNGYLLSLTDEGWDQVPVEGGEIRITLEDPDLVYVDEDWGVATEDTLDELLEGLMDEYGGGEPWHLGGAGTEWI